jgi:hypothetical protein
MRIDCHHRLVCYLPASGTVASRLWPGSSFRHPGLIFPCVARLLIAPGIVFAILARELLRGYVEIAYPVLIYPCLSACFTFALWLVFSSLTRGVSYGF